MQNICIYTKTKNKINVIDRWFNSGVGNLGNIIVIDEFSTDGTFEHLLDLGVKVIQKDSPTPADFSKLSPKNTTYVAFVDIETILNDEIIETIQNIDGDYDKVFYELVNNPDITIYNKHQYTFSKSGIKYKGEQEKVLNLVQPDKNMQDDNESVSFEELTQNINTDTDNNNSDPVETKEQEAIDTKEAQKQKMMAVFDQAYDYFSAQDYDNAITYFEYYVNNYNADNELGVIENVLAATYLLAKIYNLKNNKHKAIQYCVYMMSKDNTYLDSYLELAEIYNSLNLFDMAIGCAKDGAKNSVQHSDWFEDVDTYQGRLEKCLAKSYIGLNDFDSAFEYINKAINENPNDIALLNTKIELLETLYQQAIEYINSQA